MVLSGTKLLLDFKSVSSSKSLLPNPCFLTRDLSLSALIFFLFSIIYDDYLNKFGFQRAATHVISQVGWGDAFYIKKK